MNKVIDEKDRKILLELDKDSRQTDSEIAKKVKLSKQVVNYRIKDLIRRKIIDNFYTIIDVGNLGLDSYYVFLQFENINKEKEKILIEKLKKLEYIGWIVNGTGRWDVIILIYANSPEQFEGLLNKTLSTCGNHIHEYSFSTLIKAEHIRYKILGNKFPVSLKQSGKMEIIKLNEIDKSILKIIDQNARMSIVEIAYKTKRDVHVINYHLKNLKKRNIIEGFKPKININSLGKILYLLLLQFQNVKQERKEEFINYCKNHKKIYYVTKAIGTYNIIADVQVDSPQDFKEVLLEIKEKFSDTVKLYESMIIFDEYKISYFPEEII